MQVFEKKLTKKNGVGTTEITIYYRKLTKILKRRMERMKRNYYLDDNTDTYCLTEKWELKTRLTTFPLGNVHGVIVRAVRRDKNTPQRLGKRRKEKEAKKKKK